MSNENFGPNFSLSGKVAFITGAGRGIGRACALACAAAGADIVLGLRDVASASELISEIGTLGRKVLPLKLDLSRLSDIDSAVAAAVDHFGRLDILVNNVGIAPGNLAEDVNEKDFDATLAVNLKGHLFHDSGCRANDDRAQIRSHHQHQLPGGDGHASRRGDLLHDKGRDQPSHALSRRRVGASWDYRQYGCPDLHLD